MHRRLLILLVLALVVAARPPAADAARGACVAGEEGPSCEVWTGTAVAVGDGDTLDVDVARDGTRRPARVRVAGIQAMELFDYAPSRRVGDCHAVEATMRLEQLVRRARGSVRLSALDPGSRSRKRLLRSVAVKIGGRWRDVGTVMLREGRALWWATRVEWAPNAAYGDLMRGAIAARRGLFDPDGCGTGPSPASPLKVWVNWDADGSDLTNPDGEWVKVRNLDPVNPVALAGWHLRFSGLSRHLFAPDAVVPPGGTVTVRWGLGHPVFVNATHDAKALGDGAYLFDPLGNVRAHFVYPCVRACHDPAEGTVGLSARPAGRRESVTLTNLTAGAVDLEGYVLKSPPHSYHLGAGTVLPPAGSIDLLVGGAAEEDTPLVKHWGIAHPILRNAGDVVRLSTYGDLTLACTAWGDRSC